MNIKQIVKEYVLQKGYDGVIAQNGLCGCFCIDKDFLDLCFCGNCSPAYYKDIEDIKTGRIFKKKD